MKPFISDSDFTLYVGDVRDVLAELPDESVDCVVTSPPYWGLRDYGTGLWEGGDDGCDHKTGAYARNDGDRNGADGFAGNQNAQGHAHMGALLFRDVCGKCGATRKDQQLGLEASPDLYVEAMVGVFREVRRVLALHGTCWVNLGDSYAANRSYQVSDSKHKAHEFGDSNAQAVPDGLKPKDLCGIPWRVAFALQADGWYLRSDIVWSKPNPMPESVTDRPTKSHEYVFMLAKSGTATYWVNGRRGTLSATKPAPDYWWVHPETQEASETPVEGWKRENAWRGRDYFFDQEAVREPHNPDGRATTRHPGAGDFSIQERSHGDRWPNSGRNIRSVWEIATQAYSEAHFAVYPEELVRRCLLAGCAEWVCGTCGKPRERIVEEEATGKVRQRSTGGLGTEIRRETHGLSAVEGSFQEGVTYTTVGWSDCGHNDYRPGICLDPFMGSGTTALVARKHGRHAVGVELNAEYAELCAARLQQLSLFAQQVEA